MPENGFVLPGTVDCDNESKYCHWDNQKYTNIFFNIAVETTETFIVESNIKGRRLSPLWWTDQNDHRIHFPVLHLVVT